MAREAAVAAREAALTAREAALALSGGGGTSGGYYSAKPTTNAAAAATASTAAASTSASASAATSLSSPTTAASPGGGGNDHQTGIGVAGSPEAACTTSDPCVAPPEAQGVKLPTSERTSHEGLHQRPLDSHPASHAPPASATTSPAAAPTVARPAESPQPLQPEAISRPDAAAAAADARAYSSTRRVDPPPSRQEAETTAPPPRPRRLPTHGTAAADSGWRGSFPPGGATTTRTGDGRLRDSGFIDDGRGVGGGVVMTARQPQQPESELSGAPPTDAITAILNAAGRPAAAAAVAASNASTATSATPHAERRFVCEGATHARARGGGGGAMRVAAPRERLRGDGCRVTGARADGGGARHEREGGDGARREREGGSGARREREGGGGARRERDARSMGARALQHGAPALLQQLMTQGVLAGE